MIADVFEGSRLVQDRWIVNNFTASARKAALAGMIEAEDSPSEQGRRALWETRRDFMSFKNLITSSSIMDFGSLFGLGNRWRQEPD